MAKRPLSKTTNAKAEREEMRYLIQPRGPGRSWVFRMATPAELIGEPNPWDGKPLQREIGKGLGTRHLPEARKRRDIVLGDIRRLQDGHRDEDAFSLSSALEWRAEILAARTEAEARGDTEGVGAEDVLLDKLEAADARGVPLQQLKRFSRVARGWPAAGFVDTKIRS